MLERIGDRRHLECLGRPPVNAWSRQVLQRSQLCNVKPQCTAACMAAARGLRGVGNYASTSMIKGPKQTALVSDEALRGPDGLASCVMLEVQESILPVLDLGASNVSRLIVLRLLPSVAGLLDE
eukprot:TRINITY_DN31963_c0_g1_i1.p2 TRINITY_DN31963_c0_g1~~TRINITY_DN31963_c0_g1_i1.p2  ORF type:complete len:124 (-),score=10.07 TRINITY_DN31963_c0_g1_i1:1150-1521(-)